MAKEILLYTSYMSSYSAESFITQMEGVKDNEVNIRVNTPGGDPYATYGMIAKFNEHKKRKKIKVDGMAKSCAFYMLCCADEVECLDASDFMVHRAAAPYWVEKDPKLFTDDVKAFVNNINGNLRKMLECKVTPQVFQTVTGTSMDDMFSLDSRIDVNITAKQALAMGIVNKINPLTAEKKTEIMALAASNGIAAFATDPEVEAIDNPTIQNNNTMAVMTAAEFKAANPTAYAEIVAEGVASENNRVSAWLEFKDIDAVAVTAAVADPKQVVDMKVISSMTVKAMAKGTLAGAVADNPAAIQTAAAAAALTPEQTLEAKNLSDFTKACADDLGVSLGTK